MRYVLARKMIYKYNKTKQSKGETEMKIFERFEKIMMAAAFAEEGDFDGAKQLMKENEKRNDLRSTQQKRQDKRQELRAE